MNKLCKCGCGKEVKLPIHTYLFNHHSKGKKLVPRITKKCKYCQKLKTNLPYMMKNFKFCSTSCSGKYNNINGKVGFKKGNIAHNKGKTKNNYEPLKRVGEKVSKTRRRLIKEGKLKSWSRNLTKETDIRIFRMAQKLKGRKRPELTGDKNPAWVGGKSFEVYPKEFNDELKQKIRNRDWDTCHFCFMTNTFSLEKNWGNLTIHHIDYDKMNCDKNNLITLCRKCNANVNGRREMYEEYFQFLLFYKYGYKTPNEKYNRIGEQLWKRTLLL